MGTWIAPSAIERELYEAKSAGDWSAYFDVLARTPLYVAQSRERSDEHPDSVFFHATPDRTLVVHTPGMLPAPTPETVYESRSLRWFSEVWAADDPAFLAVNPRSPVEAYLTTTPADLARWRAHAQAAPHYGLPEGRIHALFTGGPLHGPVAHGLAVGCHLAVTNGEFWNSLAHHGSGYQYERHRVAKSWSITDRPDWLATLDTLLDRGMVSPVWEYALRVRRALASDFAGPVDIEHWRHTAEASLRRGAERAAEPQLTPDGVTAARPRPAAEVEGEIAGVKRLIGRITRYEQRFRADGLLPEDGWVRSVEGWDIGRASQMARWGVSCRYGTVAEAEKAVLRAGEAARDTYRSWAEFSAGYVLGRCLHFDEEEFGTWYTTALAAHLALTTDPASPWLNIPWK